MTDGRFDLMSDITDSRFDRTSMMSALIPLVAALNTLVAALITLVAALITLIIRFGPIPLTAGLIWHH